MTTITALSTRYTPDEQGAEVFTVGAHATVAEVQDRAQPGLAAKGVADQ